MTYYKSGNPVNLILMIKVIETSSEHISGLNYSILFMMKAQENGIDQ